MKSLFVTLSFATLTTATLAADSPKPAESPKTAPTAVVLRVGHKYEVNLTSDGGKTCPESWIPVRVVNDSPSKANVLLMTEKGHTQWLGRKDICGANALAEKPAETGK